MEKTICELFAGVGGFRLGFDRLDSGWRTTWFSQWEPGAATQWAHQCYVQHYGEKRNFPCVSAKRKEAPVREPSPEGGSVI